MRLPPVRTANISLGGGLDLVSPHNKIGNGMVVEAQNFVADLNGGYTKHGGYERTCGGLPLISNLWYGLKLNAVTGVALNTIVADSTTGTTATVVAIDSVNNVLCVTNLTGEFTANNPLTSHPELTIVLIEQERLAVTAALYNEWQLASDNYWRNLLPPVPGVGDTLGVWMYNNDIYAFRSNGTKVIMYKGTGTAWAVVPFYTVLNFDTGTMLDGDVLAGDTINGQTSGATGIVKKFIKNAGSFGSTASGYMIVQTTGGTFVDNENIREGATVRALVNGAPISISFNIGANKFNFVNYNFYATSTFFRMYGCDGVNPAFEFDGTTLTPILYQPVSNAPAVNAPKYIEAHKNYLWLAFAEGSLQASVLGEPVIFSGFLGAAEYGMGYEIVGIKAVLDNALLIATTEDIKALYGTTTSDFQLKVIAANTGCIAQTMAISVRPYIMTKKGIIRVDPTQSFGNFESSTVSRKITPLLQDYIANKGVVSAGISRSLNQYKIYFNDGSGVIMSQDVMFADNKLPSFTTFQYAHVPTCVGSVSVDDQNDLMLFGDKDGYVYSENTGSNCDGLPMECSLRTPYLDIGSGSVRKSFKRIEFDINSNGNAEVRFNYTLSYGQLHTESGFVKEVEAVGAGGYWGANKWLDMTWGTAIVDQQIFSLTGTGHNISVQFYTNSSVSDGYTVNSMVLHYIQRRLNRG